MDVLKQDVDRLLSYETKQQVSIKDKWLGITNGLLQLLILSYIVGYVFIYDNGHLEFEYAKGVTTTHVDSASDLVVASSGKTRTRSFSVEELTYPPLESNSLFVATKIDILKQTRGVCSDDGIKCDTNGDCHTGGTCESQGVCLEKSWCKNSETAEVYKTSTGKLAIWVKSMIQFHGLNKERIFTTDVETPHRYPADGATVYSVEDLLLLCDPPVRYEEISELGAAVEVQFRWWNCPVNRASCKPEVFARRIDTLFDVHNIGFEFKRSIPYQNDANVRYLYTYRGVRFYFRTMGKGEEVSIASIIFKIATGIALLTLAPLLSDWIMLRVFKKGNKYAARKYEYSQDLGDYFDELAKRPKAVEVSSGEEDQENEEDIAWRQRMEEAD